MPAGNVRVRAYFDDKIATVIDKDGNTIADFANMDWAVMYAEANEGSTIKLLDNINVAEILDRNTTLPVYIIAKINTTIAVI